MSSSQRWSLEHVSLAHLRPEAAQAQIHCWCTALPAGHAAAIIVESAFVSVNPPFDVPLVRVAGGCVCCVGHLVLRVELTRLLRRARPSHLLVLLASEPEHLDRFAAQLAAGEFGVEVGHVDIDHA